MPGQQTIAVPGAVDSASKPSTAVKNGKKNVVRDPAIVSAELEQQRAEQARLLAERARLEEERKLEEEQKAREEERRKAEEIAERNRIVYSEPLKEIVHWPVKITELYLGKRSINRLRDFDQFLNLEVLWLNDNRLQTVDGIQSLWKLKELYLHDNQIESLGTSFRSLRSLSLLTLQNNRLPSLHDVLAALKHLELVEFSVFGNPLCDDPRYSTAVVQTFSRLEIFDRHRLTELERKKGRIQSFNPDLARTPSSPSSRRASQQNSPVSSRTNSRPGSPALDGTVPALALNKFKLDHGPVQLSNRPLSPVEKDLYRQLERIKKDEDLQRQREQDELRRKYPWRYETYSTKMVENEIVDADMVPEQLGRSTSLAVPARSGRSASLTPNAAVAAAAAGAPPSVRSSGGAPTTILAPSARRASVDPASLTARTDASGDRKTVPSASGSPAAGTKPGSAIKSNQPQIPAVGSQRPTLQANG